MWYDLEEVFAVTLFGTDGQLRQTFDRLPVYPLSASLDGTDRVTDRQTD
jgi:hypothetical protein